MLVSMLLDDEDESVVTALFQVQDKVIQIRQRPHEGRLCDKDLENAQDQALTKQTITELQPRAGTYTSAFPNVGLVVWQAGLVLADYLLRTQPAGPWKGVRVLELGCGVGQLGIPLAMAGAEVLLTDLPHIVPLTQENVDLNKYGMATPATVMPLLWGSDTAALGYGSQPPDLVVAADVLYEPQYYPLLLATLKELCPPPATETTAEPAADKLPAAVPASAAAKAIAAGAAAAKPIAASAAAQPAATPVAADGATSTTGAAVAAAGVDPPAASAAGAAAGLLGSHISTPGQQTGNSVDVLGSVPGASSSTLCAASCSACDDTSSSTKAVVEEVAEALTGLHIQPGATTCQQNGQQCQAVASTDTAAAGATAGVPAVTAAGADTAGFGSFRPVCFVCYRVRKYAEHLFEAQAAAAGFAVEHIPLHELHPEYRCGGWQLLKVVRTSGSGYANSAAAVEQ